ncbi:MAG: hypothetical protein GX616_12300 [Planctomycetes bacterium]|nr:hypothetical protein [Planctomycetota bacterium]
MMIGNRVCGVGLMTKQERIPVRAKVAVDATGDGDNKYCPEETAIN